MNKGRRKQISDVLERVEGLEAELEELKTEISDIQTDEENYLDAMPENLAGSEKAQTAEDAIAELGNAVDAVEEMETYIEDAKTALEAARE